MRERCSMASRMARFHAPVRDIPASYLETVLSDPAASLLAVPERASAVVALASLVPGCGSSAELGVLVEDAWQRHGIGRHLVAHLIAAAPARQITELTASVLAQNGKVADLLRHVPGDFSVTRGDDRQRAAAPSVRQAQVRRSIDKSIKRGLRGVNGRA
jgi:GNAT superfamily N-acetyltransferase